MQPQNSYIWKLPSTSNEYNTTYYVIHGGRPGFDFYLALMFLILKYVQSIEIEDFSPRLENAIEFAVVP